MPIFRQLVLEKELEERLQWLIRLRWFAIAGVFVVILITRFLMNLDVQFIPLLIGNALLLVYNSICSVCIRGIHADRDNPDWFKKASRLGNIQISVDLTLLAYLIHFAGGIENPFIFFFIFHMVIGSILLSNLAAFLQWTYAALLLWGLYWLEATQTIPHYHLTGFLNAENCLKNSSFMAGHLTVFTGTLLLIVYMATSIVNRMREGERELAIANQKLAEKDKIKSQYVLKVSHDIQSSLSTIQSLLDNIIQGYAGPIENKPLDLVKRAEGRSIALMRFVKELLDLSRMRAADEIEKEVNNMREHIEQSVRQLNVLANKKQLDIQVLVTEDVEVFANKHALEGLLGNLIGNAIRYTPAGGHITIKQVDDDSSDLQFAVSDTGIGIPEDSIPHIFEDFYRAGNARSFNKTGTGLGMSIVKQIIESHGGRIWVESRLKKGTTVFFTLPITKK